MELYLVRHTAPVAAAGLCYGQSEVDVDPAETLAAAARLRTLLPVAAPLFSSPLRRCRVLAEALAGAPRFDERLREMHFGQWEMQPWSAIPRPQLDAWRLDLLGFAPPGGESAAALYRRAGAFLQELPGAAETAVIVAHAGVLRALAGHLLALPPAEWTALHFEFGSASLIRGSSPGAAALVWHNRR
ncbi:MAG: alpha-ribazole phosphatase family protein [Pseudomonadota bacterium]